jgi:hypothetical protein
MIITISEGDALLSLDESTGNFDVSSSFLDNPRLDVSLILGNKLELTVNSYHFAR